MSNQPPQPTYWDYLRLLDLLRLQGGSEESDQRLSEDELHFVIVHQVFELWLKLVLRELRLARDRLAAEWVPERHLPHLVRHLRRVVEIFRLSIDSFAVLETLTPQDFLDFRRKLGTSSGFQSFQMRELELLIGWHAWPTGVDPLHEIVRSAQGSREGQVIVNRIEQVRHEPSLRDALLYWLSRTPIQGVFPSDDNDRMIVDEFASEYQNALARYEPSLVPEFDKYLAQAGDNQRLRRALLGIVFIESYRDLPLLSWPYVVLESIVEFEEQLVLWRTRHARTVERMIGRRLGTGGSSGFAYLDATTGHRVFQELWAVRTILVPREYLPPLRGHDLYQLCLPSSRVSVSGAESPSQ
jgi:tryptophan 2,3-dioxygenase